MQDQTKYNIVKAFVREWTRNVSAKSILHIKASTFTLFPGTDDIASQEVTATQFIPENDHYDLILGELPFGMNSVEWNDGTKTIKAQRNWIELLKTLSHLDKDGTALFLLGPLGFGSAKGLRFEKELNEQGFYVNAYFNCPERILEPETKLTPIIVSISLRSTSEIFRGRISR